MLAIMPQNMSNVCRPSAASSPTNNFLLLLLYCYLCYVLVSIFGVVHVIHAEIAPSTADIHHRPTFNKIEENVVRGLSRNNNRNNANVCSNTKCSIKQFNKLASAINDIEDLKLGVPVHIAFKNRKKKRFLLHLNSSMPLNITFSQNVARKIYFNRTINLSETLTWDPSVLQLPCALPGDYDIFIYARQRGSFKIEADTIQNDLANLPLLNRTQHQLVTIQNQNQVRKKRMKVKWDKSKIDFHVMQYCLIVSQTHAHTDFCAAIEEHYNSVRRSTNRCCYFMDYTWFKPTKKVKDIVPRITNVICTGSRTQQVLQGLSPGRTYYLDIFGIHTKRNNISIHLGSKRVIFKSAHPTALRQDAYALEKISGLDRKKVFSFKIPAASVAQANHTQFLRYLVLPCNGSAVDVHLTMQHNATLHRERNIYMPTYFRLRPVTPGQRYLIRFRPSNTDEKLRLHKIGLTVTTAHKFQHFAELPENITVTEYGKHCTSATIAWHSSPDERNLSYCIIVFNLPQRNRSSIDYTNYCMDFGKYVTRHPHFYSINCKEKQRRSTHYETERIMNLIPGESYLVYVTANLSNGQPIPYQSLKLKMHKLRCNELDD